MSENHENIDWNYILQRESVRVEWRENVDDPLDIVKTLCAFANDFQRVGGGRVVCGLRGETNAFGESASIVTGVDETGLNDAVEKLTNYCQRYVEPPLAPEISEYPLSGNTGPRLLVIAIGASPHAHRFDAGTGDSNYESNYESNYYIRLNKETRPANDLSPQLLERKKTGPPFSEQGQPDATIDDIDFELLKENLDNDKHAFGFEHYLKPGNRVRGDISSLVTSVPGGSGRENPRNFSLILFGKEPFRYFRGAYVSFSVYSGKTTHSEQIQQMVIHGSIPFLVGESMNRLYSCMGSGTDKNGGLGDGKRTGRKYSEAAVVETIVNALIHRDYRSDEPVKIMVFENRVEIVSPGGLFSSHAPGKISIDQIGMAWRNPSLAAFMGELGLARNMGKGLEKMAELTKLASGKDVKFKITKHWFVVSIPT